MPGDFGLIVGTFVAEKRAARVEMARSRAGLEQEVLVKMTDLMPEMTERGPTSTAGRSTC